MRKSRLGRRLSASVMGIAIIVLVVFSKETTLLAKAAQTPVITNLGVAVSADGTGVIAKCSYQNYTDQSGCEMRLYLYKVENGGEVIESQKVLAYAEEGNDSTQSKQVDEGMYRASVTIDDGIDIKQINSSNYYHVSRVEGGYIVTEENGKGELMHSKTETSCSHTCEYTLIEQATPMKDAIQAYQCIKCGAVLEYIEIPNSAYAAFLTETVNLIQNAQQEEVIVNTDRWISFNRDVFEAMKIRPDISLKINYRYCGEEYLLVIPSGVDVDLLMDENGFGGFRYIEKMLEQMEQNNC